MGDVFSKTNRVGELRTGNTHEERPEADILQQQVKKQQLTNTKRLDAAKETFKKSSQTVDELINWSIERPAPRPNRLTTYEKFCAAERAKVDLEDYHDELHKLRKQVNNEAERLSAEVKPVTEDLRHLQSENEIVYNHGMRQLLQQKISEQKTISRQNEQSKEALLEQAASQIKKIDEFAAMAERTLEDATKDYHKLKDLLKQYPYFREEDMLPTYATIEFVPRGRYPGTCLVNVVRTLLKAQGVDVTDEKYINQKLGLHPLGGGIDARKLDTILPSLGDQKGYIFRKKYRKRTLRVHFTMDL